MSLWLIRDCHGYSHIVAPPQRSLSFTWKPNTPFKHLDTSSKFLSCHNYNQILYIGLIHEEKTLESKHILNFCPLSHYPIIKHLLVPSGCDLYRASPFVHEAGCSKHEGGINLETRPSSSSLSESEMTCEGLGTLAHADLHCWTKPLGPGIKIKYCKMYTRHVIYTSIFPNTDYQ